MDTQYRENKERTEKIHKIYREQEYNSLPNMHTNRTDNRDSVQ